MRTWTFCACESLWVDEEEGLKILPKLYRYFTFAHFQELRKLLAHFLKLNQNLVASGQKCLTGLQAKLHYLKIISELPSYGAKCFSTNLSVSISDAPSAESLPHFTQIVLWKIKSKKNRRETGCLSVDSPTKLAADCCWHFTAAPLVTSWEMEHNSSIYASQIAPNFGNPFP